MGENDPRVGRTDRERVPNTKVYPDRIRHFSSDVEYEDRVMATACIVVSFWSEDRKIFGSVHLTKLDIIKEGLSKTIQEETGKESFLFCLTGGSDHTSKMNQEMITELREELGPISTEIHEFQTYGNVGRHVTVSQNKLCVDEYQLPDETLLRTVEKEIS